MSNGKTFLFFVLALLISIPAEAATPAGFKLGVEPIVGYERVQKFIPTPHTRERLTYGARVTAGIPLVAAEAEYTRASDTKDLAGITDKQTDDKIKLGLRSSLRMGSLLSFILRGGAQALRGTEEQTISGVTTKTVSPWVYDPYAGLGLGIHLGTQLTLTLNVTAIFSDFPDMSKNDYQTSAGVTVKFP